MISPTPLLSTTEAAHRLGLTNRSIQRLIKSGQLAGYRVGRYFKVRAEDVDAYLASCKVEPDAQYTLKMPGLKPVPNSYPLEMAS